ncbi:glycoside hydrolase family 97 protein [Novipirellula artificiosorum]|uniref:Retaining alpha-galactosidase n=1 Tax=Novipirellula artificiosorum TaxID=2528016 RepID=A0A5C6DZQ8_9BACT|nr:glycoside hydrolase family 97 protein [Novipirellula artificiosorum]TWU42128.1 Retaining alpha-galactosidase precursor [Novipirellula artificiosorum]
MNSDAFSKTSLHFLFLGMLVIACHANANAIELRSPDGLLVAEIDVNSDGGIKKLLTYRATWKGRPVLTDSQLGLDVEGMSGADGVRVVDVHTGSFDQTWTPICGERSMVRNHYNEVSLQLQALGQRPCTLQVTFRAFNEGLAFRYTLPQQSGLDQVTIEAEWSEFQFPADHKTWVAYRAQADYEEARLSEVKPGCERPLTIQADEDRYVAIGEAGLVDFARMKFAPLKGSPFGLVSHLDGQVQAKLPLSTPWRFVMVASRPGELIENNCLVLNLNEPCAIAEPSWIKPGKVIREVTLTTDGGKALVDFAVKRGLQYIHFDAGWYGHEYDDASDATTVTVDPKRSAGPLALQEVIAYAKQHEIGVILYVNRRALEKQLDEILPLYQSWGIAGVKYGFVNVGSQKWTTWLHDAIRKAADHQLMVDVHDEYRPTGFERTYPNLMTAEGIAGDETSPTNRNTLTLLYSRMLCGPADNTVCYFSSRVDKNATHAYQLAKAVCIYSPWQYLYWYDRPAAADEDRAEKFITDEPELEFFDALPTTWDETRVLQGEIGRYALIARRKGEQWFIGAMNSGTERTLIVPLDFLASGHSYVAHRYVDNPSIDTRTKVQIVRTPVDASSVLRVEMSSQGGQAIRIAPK